MSVSHTALPSESVVFDRLFATEPTTLGAGESVVLSLAGTRKFSTYFAAGAPTYVRCNSDGTTEYGTDEPLTSLTAVDVDWPYVRIDAAVGESLVYALIP